MPVYKNHSTGTWYCKFYYTDWKGEKKQKFKRGFKLQRDAKEYERKFLEQFARNPDITFEALYEKYKLYIIPRIRESTAVSRFRMLDKHVLPFFRTRLVSSITPADIAAWQTELLSKKLSNTYMYNINLYLKAIFRYAVDYMNLPQNPCKKSIGSLKTKKLDFWTPDEYKSFSDACRDNKEYFIIFEILYYTGMREGELLALTPNDIDFQNQTIFINKTYCRITGKDIINPPKTEHSERIIKMPEFLSSEIQEYLHTLPKLDSTQRIFQKRPQYLRRFLINRAQKANVKIIRIHDIRHSHASLLIDLGANPVLVAERLGHESPNITMKTYAHLFPSTHDDIVKRIQKIQ